MESPESIPTPSTEASMKAALAPFGWTCGPDFWPRYYTDRWIFNLANAVEVLTARLSLVPAWRVPTMTAAASQAMLDRTVPGPTAMVHRLRALADNHKEPCSNLHRPVIADLRAAADEIDRLWGVIFDGLDRETALRERLGEV